MPAWLDSSKNFGLVCLFVCFVAVRPQSTAIVMARSESSSIYILPIDKAEQ